MLGFAIILFSAVIGLLIYGIRKTARKAPSKLTIHEHPSSFTKPGIEYVTKNEKEESPQDEDSVDQG